MIRAFFSALGFYTRIPVPRKITFDQKSLNNATVFLPLIGLLVGAAGAGICYASILIFPKSVSIVLALITTVLITGAFHEDGFSDTCDGLGGGWTIEEKLKIMKDSRVGAFGLIGSILLFFLKYAFLTEIPRDYLLISFIAVHVISRLTPVFLIFFLPYVRKDETSKAKPVSKGISLWILILAMVMALFIVFLLKMIFLLLFIILPFLVIFFSIFYKKQLGGYTGDLLGASQQVSEIFLLAGIYLICTFIV